MNTPPSKSRSQGSDLAKKTRATSCTSCRQVKVLSPLSRSAYLDRIDVMLQLKCDLKERYPQPCSRCTANHSDCRTDSSFKRIPARSRIKDLEKQIDQLKRNQTLSQASDPRPSRDITPEVAFRAPNHSLLEELSPGHASSDRISHESPSGSEIGRNEVKWMNVPTTSSSHQFVLGNFSLPYPHAYELFSHFEDQYYQHFCILEPISSLTQLHSDSEFLFWSIALVASRNHLNHSAQFDDIRTRISGLVHQVVAGEEMQSLLDLQAFLLLCSFNCRALEQSRDPGWLHIGMAVNAARQMGLDKDQDEVLFGAHKNQHSLTQHPRHIRQMTWMKCFELDVQLSCWHGHLPTLGYPHLTRNVAKFCEALPVNVHYAAVVSVHVELAQWLLALEGNLSTGHECPHSLVRMFDERCDALKNRWASVWSLDAEIELLTARLYVYGAYLVMTEQPDIPGRSNRLYLEVLQASQSSAVQLASLITNIHNEAMVSVASRGIVSNLWPLSGRPKSHTLSAGFAACVLLKYLDDPRGTAEQDGEAARNAYIKIYQVFAACPASTSIEHQNKARILEIAGRAIGRGRGQMQSFVTTRMGASLRFNVMWLASQLRAKDENPEIRIDESNLWLDEPIWALSTSLLQTGGFNLQYGAAIPTTTTTTNLIFSEPTWQPPAAADTMGYEEVWGHAGFDGWQTSLPSPASTTSVPSDTMPVAFSRA